MILHEVVRDSVATDSMICMVFLAFSSLQITEAPASNLRF